VLGNNRPLTPAHTDSDSARDGGEVLLAGPVAALPHGAAVVISRAHAAAELLAELNLQFGRFRPARPASVAQFRLARKF
jgi:hypothetical protein